MEGEPRVPVQESKRSLNNQSVARDSKTCWVFLPRPISITQTAQSSHPERTGYLYGWKTPDYTIIAGAFAGSIDTINTRLQHADTVLWRTGQPKLEAIGQYADSQVNYGEGEGEGNHVFVISRGVVRLKDSSIEKEDNTGKGKGKRIIYYAPPLCSNLQFYALNPVILDLNNFVQPLKSKRLATYIQYGCVDKAQGNDLRMVIDLINRGPWIPSPVRIRAPPLPSFQALLTELPRPTFLDPVSRLIRGVLSLPSWVLNYKFQSKSIKDFSSACYQIDTRISQALFLPAQQAFILRTITSHSCPTSSPEFALSRAHYIQCYNTIWLIINDVIIGYFIVGLMYDHLPLLASYLEKYLRVFTITYPKEALDWLNSWPGGIKLNSELASTFCRLFDWMVDIWEERILDPLINYLPRLIAYTSLSGYFGCTLFLSILSDVFSLFTLHLFLSYTILTSLFRWHLTMLISLFDLFMGKHYNTLRKRREPVEYEVDQLVLGTIMFVLGAFLFPTVGVYYLFFVLIRLGIVSIHAIIELIIGLLNHFPLFAAMLRIKDPARLPGGITFTESGGALVMKNDAISIQAIFYQHVVLLRQLISHYSPLLLLRKIVHGNEIIPIPRVRLSLWITKEGCSTEMDCSVR